MLLEVSHRDIENLNDNQLTELLIKLLHLEVSAYQIPAFTVEGSLNINIGDDGEDACVLWEGNPERTNWLPSNNVLFQCKATTMGPAKCKTELLKNGNELKGQVEKLLDNDGVYILFYNKPLVRTLKQDRIKKFREALSDANKPYKDSAKFYIYDSNSIAEWTNCYISAITSVLNWNQKTVPSGLLTWEEWKGYRENKYEFIVDETLSQHMEQLRTHFTEPKQIARITGLSGLGKTRLALEAFRYPDDEKNYKQKSLSDLVSYIDAGNEDINGLFSTIHQWRLGGLKGLIVVDNCDLGLHEQLVKEIEHESSYLSLLTMDFHSAKSSHPHAFIELGPLSNEVIEGIIRQQYEQIVEEDIKRILEIAEGFPQMAVLLAEARLNDAKDIGSLNNDVLVKKLLWGRREESSEALDVISACALFESIGFSEELSHQRQFVAEKVCRVDNDVFYKHVVDFKVNGIIDERGRTIRVTPRPLSIRLAADWWRRCSPERAKELLLETMPDGMVDKLCEQLSKLSFLEEAKDITANLCNGSSPFGQAEVLVSDKGSRIFRSLVEVNPKATMEALDNAIGTWGIDELKSIQGKVRRNIVWSLEKLTFWEETFEIASKLLLRLGAAENESWGNNATNQFFQLFHVFLSGTKASPDQRLEIIDEGLLSKDHEIIKISVQALGHALKTEHFNRMVGVEYQGGRFKEKEWFPETWEQVFDYWQKSIERLVKISCENDQFAELARNSISNSIRGLVRYGLMEVLDKAIKVIITRHTFWPEALEEIEDAIKFEGPKIPAEGLLKLKEWVKLLKPSSIEAKIKLYISLPPWGYEETKDGLIDAYDTESRKLAKEIINQKIDLTNYLHLLLIGEQRKGYIFGQSYAELNTDHSYFIFKCLSFIRKGHKDLNPIMVIGYLSVLRNTNWSLFSEALENIVTNEALIKYAIPIYRLLNPSTEDLKRLLNLLNEEKLSVSEFKAFSYNSVLSHLPVETINWFASELQKFGVEGSQVALDIIYMNLHGEFEKFPVYEDLLKRIFMTKGILSNGINTSIDFYAWKSIALHLLEMNENKELAEHITHEIIELAIQNKYLKFDLLPVIKKLLINFLDEVWPYYSSAMLSDNWLISSTIIDLVHVNVNSDSFWINEVIPLEFFKAWCEENPVKAPIIIPKISEMFINDGKSISLTELAKFLLENYPNKDVLTAIWINSHPKSWVGSMIPHLEIQKNQMLLLARHSNPKVKNWAKKVIKNINQEIKKEKQREEEEGFGFYNY